MARSELDRDRAVKDALEVFWRNGYEETSVAHLVEATGFNRYALYSAFGGKLDVFLAVLDAYYLERKNIFLTNLNDPDIAPMDAVRSVFEFAITEMAERGAGCLICNIASEVGAQDTLILERINAYLEEIQCAYCEALSRAEAQGALNPSLTPEEGARLLIALKLGLGAHAKNGMPLGEMLAVFEAGMSALGNRKAS